MINLISFCFFHFQVTAKYIHATLKNTSMTISNLPGPIEQMLIAGHPVKSFHFTVVGVPQVRNNQPEIHILTVLGFSFIYRVS
jgi:WS/DGAT C-terminal domain